MTNLQEFTFPSSDGKTAPRGTAWLPETRHMTDAPQIARHNGFARSLNEPRTAVADNEKGA